MLLFFLSSKKKKKLNNLCIKEMVPITVDLRASVTKKKKKKCIIAISNHACEIIR